jgi:hypothetical protein
MLQGSPIGYLENEMMGTINNLQWEVSKFLEQSAGYADDIALVLVWSILAWWVGYLMNKYNEKKNTIKSI